MPEPDLAFEVLLIFALVLANGVFAMSEIAVVSARKIRLQQRSARGDAGARRALELANNPTRFLSTVQIGITLVGVFAGAYGGVRIAAELGAYLERFPALSAYSEEIALGIVVVSITYLSLVVGELVPKRIALNQPERIASLVAGPMDKLSLVTAPVVKLLSLSTEAVLRILRIRKPDEPPVTEADVASLLDVGMATGVFEEEEHDLVERVFWLGDQRVAALMTPRSRIAWFDVHGSEEQHREMLTRLRHSRYLVCDGGLDQVLGMVRAKDILADLLAGRPLDLRTALRKPLLVPERLRALRFLEIIRESGIHIAVVVDERGAVTGLVTLNDVLEEIAGDLGGRSAPEAKRRADGSWLVDAAMTMREFWKALGLEDRRADERPDYRTVGGLVVTELGRIPRVGDTFEIQDLWFEVVDMDGQRVDKVLVSVALSSAEPG